MISIIRDESPQVFLNEAEKCLYENEPSNSLMLGICGNLIRSNSTQAVAPVLLRVLRDHSTVTAAIQTPPANLVLTNASKSDLDLIAQYLKDHGADFPGVVGPAEEVAHFASVWAKMNGKKPMLGMSQKIYKITEVKIPYTLGSMRLATQSETAQIAQWLSEFAIESLPVKEQRPLSELQTHAARAISAGQIYVWSVEGRLTTMAMASRPTRNGISISAVYTPKHLRKNGYASALVARLSQHMLDTGKEFCVLYTDLANPTSNRIYQNVGYKEVSDSKYVIFEDPSVDLSRNL